MKDLMMSSGLIERLDVSATNIPILVAIKFYVDNEPLELVGNFISLKSSKTKVIEFSVSTDDNPFNIFGSNKCEAIIKNNGKNLSIDFEISSIEFTGGDCVQIRVESKEENQ